MANYDNDLDDYEFILLFFVILFSWILIDLYGKVLHNFCYHTMGMDEHSSWNALLIAIFITIIFFICIYYLGERGKLVQNKVIGISSVHNATAERADKADVIDSSVPLTKK